MQRQGGGFWRRGSRRARQGIVVPFGQKQPFLRRRRQRRVFAAHGLESAARKNPPFPCRHQKNLIFPQSLRHQPPPRKLGGPRWLRATAGGAALHSKGAPERMQRQGGGFWRRGSRRAGQEIIVPFGQKQPFLRRRRQRRVFAAHGLESAARKNPPFPCRHQKNLIFPQSLRHQPPPRKLGGPRWLRATAGGAALRSKGAPERMQRRGCGGEGGLAGQSRPSG